MTKEKWLGSAISKISASLKELQKNGKKVIDLSIGEPNFLLPNTVKQGMINFIESNQRFSYFNVQGEKKLREAISAHYNSNYNLLVDPDNILVGSGARQIMANAFLADLNPGDEVILFKPFWPIYEDLLRSIGASIIFHDIEDQDLSSKISPRTKWLIFNFPNNPSGRLASKEKYQQIAKILEPYPTIKVMSDEIYDQIVYDGPLNYSFLNYKTNNVVVVHGFSKTFGLTGLRIGYGIINNKELLQKMKVVQSSFTAGVPLVLQEAACQALSLDRSNWLDPLIKELTAKKDFLSLKLEKFNDLEFLPPGGTHFFWLDIRKWLKKFGCKDDFEFFHILLNQTLIGGVPGSAFGNPGYFRISFSCPWDDLELAIINLQKIF